MPEKFSQPLAEIVAQALTFVAVGMVIALGQMLQSKDDITLKLALGRCITTGGLALAAGSALTLFPDLPFGAQLGIAAGLASLGNSGLELLLQKVFGKGQS